MFKTNSLFYLFIFYENPHDWMKGQSNNMEFPFKHFGKYVTSISLHLLACIV